MLDAANLQTPTDVLILVYVDLLLLNVHHLQPFNLKDVLGAVKLVN